MKCANIEIIPTGNDLWLTGPDWTGLVVTGTGWLNWKCRHCWTFPVSQSGPRLGQSYLRSQSRSDQSRSDNLGDTLGQLTPHSITAHHKSAKYDRLLQKY